MKKIKDFTEMRFGKLVVTRRSSTVSKCGNRFWYCDCDCGTKDHKISSANLKNTKSCGCWNTIDLKGRKFGKLTVIKQSSERTGPNRDIFWICKCKCGNIKRIRGSSLRGNLTKSCGCVKRKTLKLYLTGRRFGKLVVKKICRLKNNNNKVHWYCDCDCGTKGIIVPTGSLRSGNTTSCGCKRAETIALTSKPKHCLIGKRFGKLTVTKFYGFKHKRAAWYCDCDCGTKDHVVAARNLMSNTTKSCRCLSRINFVGMRFGKLVITKKMTKNSYLVDCDCGTKDHKVLKNNLLSRSTISCGCLRKEMWKNSRFEFKKISKKYQQIEKLTNGLNLPWEESKRLIKQAERI